MGSGSPTTLAPQVSRRSEISIRIALLILAFCFIGGLSDLIRLRGKEAQHPWHRDDMTDDGVVVQPPVTEFDHLPAGGTLTARAVFR